MKYRKSVAFSMVLVLLLSLFMVGCGNQKETKEQTDSQKNIGSARRKERKSRNRCFSI